MIAATFILLVAYGADVPPATDSKPIATPPPQSMPADIIETGWGVAPEPKPVPQPDFEKVVDYIAWFDDAQSYAANDNALSRYGIFLYGDDAGVAKSLAPQADTFAAKDLAKLMEQPRHWSPEEKRGLTQWMHNVERRFTRVLLEANQHQYYATRRTPDLTLLVDIQAPALGNARTIGQMLIARSWRVRDGSIDADMLPEALIANFVIARHFSQGATFEEQLFASGQRDFIYDLIRRSLDSPVHTAHQWQEVISALEKYDDRPITHDFARGLFFAEAAALQLLQHFCTTVDSNGFVAVAPKIQDERVREYAARRYPGGKFAPPGIDQLSGADPKALAARIHEYYSAMRSLLTQRDATGLATNVARVESTLTDHPGVGLLVTPVGMSVQTVYRTEAKRRLAYLYLKMAIDFKFTGSWPDSFDKLTGSRVAESRIDPYSGQDMHFLTIGPARVPYSIGPDGNDDNGDSNKDIIYWGRVSQEAYFHTQKNADSNGEPAAATSNGSAATQAAPSPKPGATPSP